MLKLNKILFIVVGTLTISAYAFAATRMLHENFDDQAIDTRLIPRVVSLGYDAVSPPVYQLNTGRGGTGKCFASGTSRDPFLEWRYSNTWPTDEMYVSFWVRYPTHTPDSDSHWNIKTFYPHWDGTQSYVGYFASGKGNLYYSAHDKNGGVLTQSNWETATGDFDGRWHHYEFYIKFSAGISRYWYDGVSIVNDNFGTGKWTTAMSYITFGGQDSTTANVFTREIDDIEVWDGIPGTPGTTPPPPTVDTTPPANPSGISTSLIR